MGTIRSYHAVGVDGGGTGCRVAIADPDGAIVGTATGGPANFTTDPAQTIANVQSAVMRAAESAFLSLEQVKAASAHVGLAGILKESDAAKMASSLPFAQTHVSDDRLTSITGALGTHDGILAAVGTGTLVAARQGDTYKYFGGWGLLLSDQASGAWLGRGALERSLLVYDGLEVESDLTRGVMARFGDEPTDLVAFARRALPSDYAAFAPMVIESARAGDLGGRALMLRGADYLNTCFNAAPDSDNAIVCLTGGVGPHYTQYIDPRFGERLHAPAGTALDGALQLARQILQPTGAPI